MANRNIDTGLFDDEWFMDLSKDAKLLFIYLITKCDHAGILKFNKKLTEYQTGLKGLEKLLKALSNRLVILNEGLIFIPNFLKVQYPKGICGKAPVQISVQNILKKYGLWDEEKQTLIKGLNNPSERVIVNDTDIVIDNDNNILKGVTKGEDEPKPYSEEFLTFWFSTRKTGCKRTAFNAFEKRLKTCSLEDINGAYQHLEHEKSFQENSMFPHVSTFLNSLFEGHLDNYLEQKKQREELLNFEEIQS